VEDASIGLGFSIGETALRQADSSAIMAEIANLAYMKTVAATEAKNRLGAILDDAQREPVVIRRQDRDIAVVLSMADYERLRSGNVLAFLELRKQVAEEAAAKGLTDEHLNELLADDDT
jgi:prevent-host-death family protein